MEFKVLAYALMGSGVPSHFEYKTGRYFAAKALHSNATWT